jgi:DNA-binding transcriptional ArsR family regulator
MIIPFDYPQLDALLDALSHQKRRGIIHNLSLQPATVSQLANKFDLSLPAIHKHIRILENSKLIARKKSGRTNFVALNPESLGIVQSWIMQYHTEWGNVDASLENYVTGMQERMPDNH